MTIIDTMKQKQTELEERLAVSTDEKSYDLIFTELAQVKKTLAIEVNKERKRLADEIEAKRKKALDDFNSEKKRIVKLKQEAEKIEMDLFEKIHTVYDTYSAAYDARMRIMQDVKQLRFRAEELGLEAPPSEKLSVCNFSDNQGDKQDFFVALLTQYDNAIRQLNNAHRSGKQAPDRPGMDWYIKGGGQFFPGQQQG